MEKHHSPPLIVTLAVLKSQLCKIGNGETDSWNKKHSLENGKTPFSIVSGYLPSKDKCPIALGTLIPIIRKTDCVQLHNKLWT